MIEHEQNETCVPPRINEIWMTGLWGVVQVIEELDCTFVLCRLAGETHTCKLPKARFWYKIGG